MDNLLNKNHKKIPVKFVLFLALFIFPPCFAQASQVSFIWNANVAGDNVLGYKLYFGKKSSCNSSYEFDGNSSTKGSSPITIPINNLTDPNNPSYTLDGLDEGDWYFKLVAYNIVGESGFTSTISKVIDASTPSLSITVPTTSSTYSTTNSSINISGTASDNICIESVTWTNDRGGSGTASGTTSWSQDGIVLQGGDNVITVTVNDSAGNSASDTLTVSYSICIDADGDSYCNPTDCNDTDADINPGANEICDGIDNDCDGEIDEDYQSQSTNCGTGACASTGQLICQAGSEVDTCQEGTPGYEVCEDQSDNDCDGEVDEDVCFIAGIAGFWNFDEGSGNIAFDEIDNANNGAINGATWTTSLSGNGLSFDGNDDYVDCGNGSSLNITGQITIEAWVNYAGSGDGDVINKVKLSNGYGPYVLYFSNSMQLFRESGDGNTWRTLIYVTNSYNTGWHHVVATNDGSAARLYVDGVLIGIDSSPATTKVQVSEPVRIGSYQDPGGDKYFKGLIDEIVIFNRALSAAEVLDRYSSEEACAAIWSPVEICDGIDNNCDGEIDEDYTDLGSSCTVGVGACQSSGTMVCMADKSGTECNATPGTPSSETCDDGIDNDCDGEIDEECNPPLFEVSINLNVDPIKICFSPDQALNTNPIVTLVTGNGTMDVTSGSEVLPVDNHCSNLPDDYSYCVYYTVDNGDSEVEIEFDEDPNNPIVPGDPGFAVASFSVDINHERATSFYLSNNSGATGNLKSSQCDDTISIDSNPGVFDLSDSGLNADSLFILEIADVDPLGVPLSDSLLSDVCDITLSDGVKIADGQSMTISLPFVLPNNWSQQEFLNNLMVCYYDTNTGTWSQNGISNVTVDFNSMLISFDTSHLSIFAALSRQSSSGGGSSSSTGSGGGGGGGCSLNPTGSNMSTGTAMANALILFFPLVILGIRKERNQKNESGKFIPICNLMRSNIVFFLIFSCLLVNPYFTEAMEKNDDGFFFGYLNLAGTILISERNQNLNKAVFQEMFTGKRIIYQEGSLLPYGIKLKRVEKDRVVLEKGRQKTALVLGEKNNYFRDIKALKRNGYQQIAPKEWIVNSHYLFRSSEDLIKTTSKMAGLGFQKGDKIIDISGIYVNVLRGLVSVYRNMKNTDNITIKVLRKGKPVELNYWVMNKNTPHYNISHVLASDEIRKLLTIIPN